MAKGKKLRGQSFYRPGEPSKRNCNLSLSESVIAKLGRLAQKDGISKSEFIERWIRSLPE